MQPGDQEPIIGIKSEDSGITYFPKFVKNRKAEWEFADKSFRKVFEDHIVSGKTVSKEE